MKRQNHEKFMSILLSFIMCFQIIAPNIVYAVDRDKVLEESNFAYEINLGFSKDDLFSCEEENVVDIESDIYIGIDWKIKDTKEFLANPQISIPLNQDLKNILKDNVLDEGIIESDKEKCGNFTCNSDEIILDFDIEYLKRYDEISGLIEMISTLDTDKLKNDNKKLIHISKDKEYPIVFEKSSEDFNKENNQMKSRALNSGGIGWGDGGGFDPGGDTGNPEEPAIKKEFLLKLNGNRVYKFNDEFDPYKLIEEATMEDEFKEILVIIKDGKLVGNAEKLNFVYEDGIDENNITKKTGTHKVKIMLGKYYETVKVIVQDKYELEVQDKTIKNGEKFNQLDLIKLSNKNNVKNTDELEFIYQEGITEENINSKSGTHEIKVKFGDQEKTAEVIVQDKYELEVQDKTIKNGEKFNQLDLIKLSNKNNVKNTDELEFIYQEGITEENINSKSGTHEIKVKFGDQEKTAEVIVQDKYELEVQDKTIKYGEKFNQLDLIKLSNKNNVKNTDELEFIYQEGITEENINSKSGTHKIKVKFGDQEKTAEVIVQVQIFTVTIHGNEGLFRDNSNTKIFKVDKDNKIDKSLLEEPIKEHHKFIGWTIGKDGKNFNLESLITENIDLYAKWEEDAKVKVEFNTDGGSEVELQEIYINNQATKPVEPTRENYKFIGWYIDEEFSEEFNFKTEIKANTTIYAKWEEDAKVKVEFNTDGGSEVELQEIYINNQATKPVEPTRENYKFIGWYIDEEFSEEFNFKTEIKANTTIYAKWEEDAKVKVEFNTDGGSEVELQEIYINNQATKPVEPTRENYKFIGWYIDEEFSEEFNFKTEIKANTTIYAKWEEDAKVKVEFNTDGGSEVELQEIYINNQATKPVEPTRENYKFIGWYIDEEFSEEFNFKTEIKANTTIYAKWEEDAKVKVEFNTDGGSEVELQEIYINNQATKPVELTRENYKFIGWYIDEEFSEEFNFKTEIKANTTIYAKWTKKSTGGGGGGDTTPPTKPEETVNIDYIILANGDKYTDVLTSTVLGNELKSPILLTKTNYMDKDTKDEIKRLNPKNIIISGGESSVSEKLVKDLKDSGINIERLSGVNSVSENTENYLKGENIKVERISGSDRYKTAVKISEKFTEK